MPQSQQEHQHLLKHEPMFHADRLDLGLVDELCFNLASALENGVYSLVQSKGFLWPPMYKQYW